MSYLDACRLSPVDFETYDLAYRIRKQDEEYNLAKLAWFQQAAKATKKSGKGYVSAYKNFDDFYNNRKKFEELFKSSDEQPKPKKLSLADLNRAVNAK